MDLLITFTHPSGLESYSKIVHYISDSEGEGLIPANVDASQVEEPDTARGNFSRLYEIV